MCEGIFPYLSVVIALIVEEYADVDSWQSVWFVQQNRSLTTELL